MSKIVTLSIVSYGRFRPSSIQTVIFDKSKLVFSLSLKIFEQAFIKSFFFKSRFLDFFLTLGGNCFPKVEVTFS